MNESDLTSSFVVLWNASSRQVYAFILSLLPNWADADEAFQETGKMLWEKFPEYRPGSDFTAWACRIAYYRAMEVRRRKQRGPQAFSDTFIEVVEGSFLKQIDVVNDRFAALASCIEKLSQRDRDILQRRYRRDGTTESVASELGRSKNAVYKVLNRIHESLYHCIRRRLAKEAT